MKLPKTLRSLYKDRIRRPLAAYGIRLLFLLAQRLPARCVQTAGKFLGILCWCGARSTRKSAERQMTEILDSLTPNEVHTHVKQLFRNLGINTLETLRLPVMSSEERLALADIEGIDLFRDAFNNGKGLLAITGHIGCWELLAAYFSDLGYPINVVARRRSNPRLGRIVSNLRANYGVRELDRERDGRKMIRALKRGEVVAMLVDQDTRVDGLFIPFLGRMAHTPTGHAKLALRTGASLVVLTIVRKNDGRHLIKVLEEVNVPDRDAEDATEFILERCNFLLSREIQKHPDQWIWFHRRWRRKLSGRSQEDA